MRAVPATGGYTCDCGAHVWRARPPAGYAAPVLVLEESDDAARCRWTMDDHYQATVVGRGNGDLHIHRHDGQEALGDIDP